MAFDKQIFALTMYAEASGAPVDARMAVCHVPFNRLEHGGFGKSIAEICLKRKQFSEWNDDKSNNENLMRACRASEASPLMVEFLQHFDEVEFADRDPTQGATHYHDHSIDPPSWTKGATQTVIIGPFTFYKDVP